MLVKIGRRDFLEGLYRGLVERDLAFRAAERLA